MAKYVKLETLVDNLNLLARHEDEGRQNVILGVVSTIRAMNPADVAQVVHCRHCRSYNKPRLGWCSLHLDRENPDDFCSYGKYQTNGGGNGASA